MYNALETKHSILHDIKFNNNYFRKFYKVLDIEFQK